MSEIFKCNGCGRVFPSKKSLAAHRWRCDPEKEEQRRRDANKGYTCECGAYFPPGKSQNYVSHCNRCNVHRAAVGKPSYDPKNINGFAEYNKGPRWNKGLTKDDPKYGDSIRRAAEATRRRMKELGENNPLVEWNKKPREEREESYRKQSATRKKMLLEGTLSQPLGIGRGKSSYFIHGDNKVGLRSTYEFIFALYLTILGYEFEYEKIRLLDEEGNVQISDFFVNGVIYEISSGEENDQHKHRKEVFQASGYKYITVGDSEIERIKNSVSNCLDIDKYLNFIYEGHNSKDYYEFDFDQVIDDERLDLLKCEISNNCPSIVMEN